MPTGPIKHDVRLTEDATAMLAAIGDKSVRQKIAAIINDLEFCPKEKGKELVGNLLGFYSKRAAGRYRIVYSIEDSRSPPRVTVGVIGIRKTGDKNDAYNLASKNLTR